MKILYIESKLNNPEMSLPEEEMKKLPKKIFIAYTLQYRETAEQIKKQLIESNISVSGFQQILGCTRLEAKDAILYIGTGKFHYLNLLLQSSDVYIIVENRIKQISKEEIESLRNKRKAAYLKYLDADNIGILVSTKPGQEDIDRAIRLKEQLKKKGKQSYIFLSNNIDISQFENYNIDSWVNTACKGLSYDNSSVINLGEIKTN